MVGSVNEKRADEICPLNQCGTELFSSGGRHCLGFLVLLGGFLSLLGGRCSSGRCCRGCSNCWRCRSGRRCWSSGVCRSESGKGEQASDEGSDQFFHFQSFNSAIWFNFQAIPSN